MTAGEWAAMGMQGTRTGPYSNHENVGIALDHDPALLDGVYYDEFLDQILKPDGSQWADHDDTRAAMYLQGRYALNRITPSMTRAVIVQRLRATPRHCVRDYLTSLKWDGQPRIHDAFCRYWNATPSPSQPADYIRAVSSNFFIALVARILFPACQVDEMVVFESAEQGLYKSSALACVGDPWYAAIHEQVHTKDFLQALQGVWLIEVSELSAFNRSQVEHIKSVITTRKDWFRGSYDRRTSYHPRQCILAGTANRDDWGRDDTGLRRFWPIVVNGSIDIAELASVRAELLAEAVHRYQAGEKWHLVPAVARAIQSERQEYDEWTGPVLEWAIPEARIRDYVTVRDACAKALSIPAGQLDKSVQMRLARIFKLAGWERRTVREGGICLKVWFPPQPLSDTFEDTPDNDGF